MSNVQYKTPDDEQRKCPKHVEFFDKIKLGKSCVLLVLLKRSAILYLLDVFRRLFGRLEIFLKTCLMISITYFYTNLVLR